MLFKPNFLSYASFMGYGPKNFCTSLLQHYSLNLIHSETIALSIVSKINALYQFPGIAYMFFFSCD